MGDRKQPSVSQRLLDRIAREFAAFQREHQRNPDEVVLHPEDAAMLAIADRYAPIDWLTDPPTVLGLRIVQDERQRPYYPIVRAFKTEDSLKHPLEM